MVMYINDETNINSIILVMIFLELNLIRLMKINHYMRHTRK